MSRTTCSCARPDEAFNLQMELPRLHAVLQRIAKQRIVLKSPGEFTPFSPSPSSWTGCARS